MSSVAEPIHVNGHQQQQRELTPEENLCWLIHAGIFSSIITYMCSDDPELVRELDAESASVGGMGRIPLERPPSASAKGGGGGGSKKSKKRAPDGKKKSHGNSNEHTRSTASASSGSRKSAAAARSQREQLAIMLRTPADALEHEYGGGGDPTPDDSATVVTSSAVGSPHDIRAPFDVSLLPADKNVILVAAHRSEEPCLKALAPTIRGDVLMHTFEPVDLARCAIGFYEKSVDVPWIAYALRANGLLLPPENMQAARNFHALANGIHLLLLAQALQRACNHACIALRIPQQRFRCSSVRSALGLPLLILFPVYLEGPAYVMGEAFKHLTHTMDLHNQQTCVRIQQRLMNIQGYNLFSALWYLVGRMLEGDVRGPEDVGPYMIKAAQGAKETEKQAILLIETWHEQNVLMRAFSVRPATPSVGGGF